MRDLGTAGVELPRSVVLSPPLPVRGGTLAHERVPSAKPGVDDGQVYLFLDQHAAALGELD